jgi:hypothetical protein
MRPAGGWLASAVMQTLRSLRCAGSGLLALQLGPRPAPLAGCSQWMRLTSSVALLQTVGCLWRCQALLLGALEPAAQLPAPAQCCPGSRRRRRSRRRRSPAPCSQLCPQRWPSWPLMRSACCCASTPAWCPTRMPWRTLQRKSLPVSLTPVGPLCAPGSACPRAPSCLRAALPPLQLQLQQQQQQPQPAEACQCSALSCQMPSSMSPAMRQPGC